jgi:DNA-binding NarL/FixJ family response regulator
VEKTQFKIAAGSAPGNTEARPATMTDVLEFVGRSRQAFHVVRLPETTIVAANTAAAELYGERPEVIIGRHGSSLFRGADEVHATIALSALAAGAVDSYCVQSRSAIAAGVNAWLCVRRFHVEETHVAVAMTVPVDQQRPLDAVENEFATARGIRWASTSAHHADRTFAILDGLTARQREIVAALLRGERTSDIAASLFVSKSTVRNHLAAIFKEFGVHSQPELLRLLRSERDDSRGPRRSQPNRP